MKACSGSKDIAPFIPNSGLDAGERPTSCPGRVTRDERISSNHRIGGLVGLISGLDVSENPEYCSPVTTVTELIWMEANCKINVLETACGNCVGARMNMVV
jgi:hypothetical protein